MKKLFWTILPILLIAGSLFGGFFIYRTGLKKEMQNSPAPSVSLPQPVETSPEPFNRKDVKLQILNGKGVAGTAKEAKEYLEGLGYKDIETENADTFDYEKTEILISKDREKYGNLLKEDLAKKYVVSDKTTFLDRESEFDAVVIIGNE